MGRNVADALGAIKADRTALTFRRGIERESLRVDSKGNLAQTPHPAGLGSKLSHPTVTTDFSEAQPELITQVSDDINQTLDNLEQTLRYVSGGIGEELLWSASMPCMLPQDAQIPLADYGTSNLARLKKTYRHGLGIRYGRAMQTICAIHYNFSFPDSFWKLLAAFENQTDTSDYRSDRYFDLMRNFRRFAWLPVYLFGASPAVCKSFVQGKEHGLDAFDEGSLYGPHATSLRSGNLGYQSETQSGVLGICYNSLDWYVTALANAICTTFPKYEALGLVDNGKHLQVNASILQSEAEFYTNIRAKCVPPSGANFLQALKSNGVEYLEVRLLDVNPYLPLGIDAPQVRFLDMLLLYCALIDSPEHDEILCKTVSDNMQDVVWRGRDETLTLDDGGVARSVSEWGTTILGEMETIAAAMDEAHGGDDYANSIATQREKLSDATLTPSGRILDDMRREEIPYFRFAMNHSIAHNRALRAKGLSPEEIASFGEIAQQSFEDQQKIEAADDVDFDTYLARINAEYRDLL